MQYISITPEIGNILLTAMRGYIIGYKATTHALPYVGYISSTPDIGCVWSSPILGYISSTPKIASI